MSKHGFPATQVAATKPTQHHLKCGNTLDRSSADFWSIHRMSACIFFSPNILIFLFQTRKNKIQDIDILYLRYSEVYIQSYQLLWLAGGHQLFQQIVYGFLGPQWVLLYGQKKYIQHLRRRLRLTWTSLWATVFFTSPIFRANLINSLWSVVIKGSLISSVWTGYCYENRYHLLMKPDRVIYLKSISKIAEEK